VMDDGLQGRLAVDHALTMSQNFSIRRIRTAFQKSRQSSTRSSATSSGIPARKRVGRSADYGL
jgi:hypothetical protein